MLYFEDLNIGQKILLGPISVTEVEIIEFAKKFDPQPFHIDAEKAKDSLFGVFAPQAGIHVLYT